MNNRLGIYRRPVQPRVNRNHHLYQNLICGLLGYFPGSTYVYDISSCNISGTLTNMLPLSDWYYDDVLQRWAWTMDGKDAYISIPINTKFDLGLPPASLAFWFNANSLDNFNPLLTGYNSSINYARFCIYTYWVGQDFYLRAYAYSAGSVDALITGKIVAGTWNHVAVTADGVKVRVYLNGQEVGTRTTTQGFSTDPLNLAWNFGADRDTGDDWTGYFTGKLASPLFWNRCLSPSIVQEIAEIDNVRLSGLILPPRRRLYAVPQIIPSSPIISNRRTLGVGLGLGL